MNTQPIILKHTFDTPVSKVWSALTNRDEMEKWYFNLKEFKAEPGFKFDFIGGPPDGIQYKHLCEVTEAVKEKKLTYTWRYDGYEGISYLTFELSAEGNRATLKLTHSGLETFPANNKDFAKENFEAGWNDIINNSLKKYLETN
ncbi:MAG: SRPBCC domain-containing protein [Bacteroidota bacterium]